MHMHRTHAVAAGAILAASAAIVAPALATPSSGFTRTELSTGLLGAVETRTDRVNDWELRLRIRDSSDLGLDRLTVTQGGHSGWHTHAGITMVTVVSGEVEWYDGSKPGCPFKVYRAGDSFIEPANNVHLVHNISSGVLTFTGVQVRPQATPGRIDAAQPAGCPAF